MTVRYLLFAALVGQGTGYEGLLGLLGIEQTNWYDCLTQLTYELVGAEIDSRQGMNVCQHLLML